MDPTGDHDICLGHLANLRRQLRDAVVLQRRLAHEQAAAARLVEQLQLEILDAECEPDGRNPTADM